MIAPRTDASAALEGRGLELEFRGEPRASDIEIVRALVRDTGFFHAAEVGVAVELVEEALAKGSVASGYHFVFAELPGVRGAEGVAGYACYGPIACTLASWDLYWIAVRADRQRLGIGRRLIEEVERRVRAAAGERIYVETSNRAQYAPTRAFYERAGFGLAAVLEGFYAPNDDKAIYVKKV